jgi:hypothetical protein
VPDPRVAAEMAVLRFRKAVLDPAGPRVDRDVGFEHEVPQLAADAVNLLVERFGTSTSRLARKTRGASRPS